MLNNDTIFALATASGGAINIIRVSGPQAIEITNNIFSKDLSRALPYSIHFGEIRTQADGLIDEVLISIFRNPHSYTGEDSTEISCHGSSYIAQNILRLLLEAGGRQAMPGEFTQRAFINGKMDLSQAEAVADLIASSNRSTHRIAINQMRGEYSKRLCYLREKLLEMTTLLELELDFSEEDVEFADRKKLLTLAKEIETEIERLSNTFRLGNALKNGVPVAIIGAPNVGKSTLLNALLREERAIVSDIQGTTRDLIEDTITLADITFRFIDTAGIRKTTNCIEQLGIERSISAAKRAQIIILLTEPGVPYPDIPIREDQHVIKLVNKTTKFQALTGVGLPELEKQLIACMDTQESDILVTNTRHYESLIHALTDIRQAIIALQNNLSSDLVSEDLRQAIYHLSSILGEINNSEVLQTIFSHFCIGK